MSAKKDKKFLKEKKEEVRKSKPRNYKSHKKGSKKILGDDDGMYNAIDAFSEYVDQWLLENDPDAYDLKVWRDELENIRKKYGVIEEQEEDEEDDEDENSGKK